MTKRRMTCRNDGGGNGKDPYPPGWDFSPEAYSEFSRNANHAFDTPCPICGKMDDGWHFRRGLCVKCHCAMVFLVRDSWNAEHSNYEKLTAWTSFVKMQEMSDSEFSMYKNRLKEKYKQKEMVHEKSFYDMTPDERRIFDIEYLRRKRQEWEVSGVDAELSCKVDSKVEKELTHVEESSIVRKQATDAWKRLKDDVDSELDGVNWGPIYEKVEKEMKEEKMDGKVKRKYRTDYTDEELVALSDSYAKKLSKEVQERRREAKDRLNNVCDESKCLARNSKNVNVPFFEEETEESKAPVDGLREVTSCLITTHGDMVAAEMAVKSNVLEDKLSRMCDEWGIGDGFFERPKPADCNEIVKRLPGMVSDAVRLIWDIGADSLCDIENAMDIAGELYSEIKIAEEPLMEKGIIYKAVMRKLNDVCHAGTELSEAKMKAIKSFITASTGDDDALKELDEAMKELCRIKKEAECGKCD